MSCAASRTLGMTVLAVSMLAGSAMADEVAAINLTGVQFKHATNQSRNSGTDTIDPYFGYTYALTGKAKGSSGILASMFPNPTELSVIFETLSPGSSAALNGIVCNASGSHPVQATDVEMSGTQTFFGIEVTFSATLAMGINENNVAFFSLTNVVISPAILVGSLTITEGAATITGLCTADFDHSGFVDTDDFDAFIEAFEAGDPSADMDCTGFVDTDDFDTFVERFEMGC